MPQFNDAPYFGKLVPIHCLPKGDPLRHFFWRLYNHPANNIYMYWSTRSEEKFSEDVFEKIICAGSKEIFVYFEENKPVGTCRIILGEGAHAHVAICGATTIDPDQKRKGVGTRLKQAVQARIKEKYPQIKRQELTYESDNPAARRLKGQGNYYEKSGYLYEGHFEHWWGRKPADYTDFPHNHPYQSWLEKNQGDNRLYRHFGYTAENYAGFVSFSEKDHYQPSNILPLSVPRFFSPKETYIANEKYSVTLGEHFQIKNKAGEVIAACKPTVDGNTNHTLTLEQVIAQDVETAIVLLQQVVKYFLETNSAIKRAELIVVATNQALIMGLEKVGFEFCGALKGRYFDKDKNAYFDEFMFDCKLFGLSDALSFIEKRLEAQAILLNKKAEIPFDFMIPEKELLEIQSRLKQSFSLEQGNLIYRLTHSFCTQDYLSIDDRVTRIATLIQNVPTEMMDKPVQQIVNKYVDVLNTLGKTLTLTEGNKSSFFNGKQDRSDFVSIEEITPIIPAPK